MFFGKSGQGRLFAWAGASGVLGRGMLVVLGRGLVVVLGRGLVVVLGRGLVVPSGRYASMTLCGQELSSRSSKSSLATFLNPSFGWAGACVVRWAGA